MPQCTPPSVSSRSNPNLEGFILDAEYLAALQAAFPDRQSLCGYGVGTDCLGAPPVAWRGSDTYIQTTGISRELGLYDDPDIFYRGHRQAFGPLRDWLYSRLVRHWMNARVGQIRAGRVPFVPRLSETSDRRHLLVQDLAARPKV